MPQRTWSSRRERQYEHIKKGLKQQGRSTDVAEEIAARTVNKERARTGEARTASRTSRKGIPGRSKMTKAQLARAVGH